MRNLFSKIDQILASFGVDAEKVRHWLSERARRNNQKEPLNESEERYYWEEILPKLYVELRKLGYTRSDLIG